MTKEIELTLGEWNDFRRGYQVLHCSGIPDPFATPIYWAPMGGHEPGSFNYKTVTTAYLFTLVANSAEFTVKEAAVV